MAEPTILNQLEPGEYQPYFQPYLDLAGDGDIMGLLAEQTLDVHKAFESLDAETAETVHEPYSWTLKQVIGHLIDEERIFGCRAHRIGSSENQPLPGFDQDLLVANSDYNEVALDSLIEEFVLLRKSNIMLFDRMSADMWRQVGDCDGKKISVRAIAFLLAGHANHHLTIVKKRLGAS